MCTTPRMLQWTVCSRRRRWRRHLLFLHFYVWNKQERLPTSHTIRLQSSGRSVAASTSLSIYLSLSLDDVFLLRNGKVNVEALGSCIIYNKELTRYLQNLRANNATGRKTGDAVHSEQRHCLAYYVYAVI